MRKVDASAGSACKCLLGLGFVGSRVLGVTPGRTDLSQLFRTAIERQGAWMLGLQGGMDLSYWMN